MPDPSLKSLDQAELIVVAFEQMEDDGANHEDIWSALDLISILQTWLKSGAWGEQQPRVNDLCHRLARRSYALGSQFIDRRVPR